ncbi:MAG: hypothetical protein IPI31_00340 [Bacteroidetes bacterium]|jgi:hypothetical protein|nr:hypothetical protein [Bacteroidota bacterium]
MKTIIILSSSGFTDAILFAFIVGLIIYLWDAIGFGHTEEIKNITPIKKTNKNITPIKKTNKNITPIKKTNKNISSNPNEPAFNQETRVVVYKKMRDSFETSYPSEESIKRMNDHFLKSNPEDEIIYQQNKRKKI